MNNTSLIPDKDPTLPQNTSGPPGKPSSPSEAANVAKEKLSELTSQAAPTSPVPAARNLSPLLEETKEEAIKNRDGHLWECVDRIKVKEGFVYRFKLRNEYDTSEFLSFYAASHIPSAAKKWKDANQKINEIFPAVERRVEDITNVREWNWELFHRAKENQPKYVGLKEKLMKGEIEAIPIPIRNRETDEALGSMGYKMEITKDGIFLEFPDENVLQCRWNEMVDAHPEKKLRKLSMLSSQGIATDEEFTKAYIDQKMVISTGIEFVHDHQVHIIPTICCMLEDPQRFSQVRDKFSAIVEGLVRKIDKARDVISQKISEIGPETSKEDREYYARLQKNMVLANSIPAIVADNLAAGNSLTLPLSQIEGLNRFSSHYKSINNFSRFVNNRHINEVYRQYQKKHNGAELSSEERRALVEGISLDWLFDQIDKFLDENKSK